MTQAIAKVSYTHADMIDFLIANPGVAQGDVALRYGYTQAWVSRVMGSDAFRAALAQRREELVDPGIAATLEERFRAVTNQAITRLEEKLESPQVSDATVLRAVELGAKALGVGGNAPAPALPVDHLARLADRLIDLQTNVRARVAQGVVYENEI